MDLYSYFYNLVKQIPRGRVSTYGSLARALGDIRAARACGVMLSQNPDPPKIPCHRVVMSDGSIGGFTHLEGIKRKIELLRSEGIEIEGNKIKNFREVLFEDFRTDYPLKKLREKQKKLQDKIVLEDDFSTNLVAGVDVSYEGRFAYGALVIMQDMDKILKIITTKMEIDFPYISTYLAFREEPVIRELLKSVDDPVLLMVDGNGILHPVRMGLATYVGIKNNVPTIGIAKKLLMGEIVENRIILDEETVGYHVKSRGRGIFVSPGYRISLDTSLKTVRKFLKFKIPEPIRIAHITANNLRRGDRDKKVYK